MSIIYVHVYIKLDFPITYTNESVLSQSECPFLHKKFFLNDTNTYSKGGALMQMYRVIA